MANSPDPRQIAVSIGKPMIEEQRLPQVEVGQPVIAPQPQVEVGTPVIEPRRGVNVTVGEPTMQQQPAGHRGNGPQLAQGPTMATTPGGMPSIQLPANPGHHAPFVARAANVVMHGRRVGWKPIEIAAAVDHIRGQYDSGYGAP